jgi:hypothetical protein
MGAYVPDLSENARLKSYTWHALAVALLYLVFFLPGLFANILFLQEARRMEKLAGEPLPGVGVLRTLLGLVALVAGLLLALVLISAAGAALGGVVHWLGDPYPVLLAVIVWGLGLGMYLAWRAQKP